MKLGSLLIGLTFLVSLIRSIPNGNLHALPHDLLWSAAVLFGLGVVLGVIKRNVKTDSSDHETETALFDLMVSFMYAAVVTGACGWFMIWGIQKMFGH